MVLIKCCDISNEVRPTEVAEPWVDCLLQEYFMQVNLKLKPSHLPLNPGFNQHEAEGTQGKITTSPPLSSPEWQGEVRRSPRGSLHGQGQSHQAHCSNRIHQVCPDSDVRDGHEGRALSLWVCVYFLTLSSVDRSRSVLRCFFPQLFPQIEEIMVQPLRDSRDHYEELKQIDDAMTEVRPILSIRPSVFV